VSTLRIDPREAKLPKWAQAAFADLRDELRRVREDFDEFADDATPANADAVANPYDEHPRLAARKGETVRFNLRRGAIDLKIDHYDSSLEVLASQGRPLAVLPKTSNHLVLTLPDY
jgi:hypothetical protein